MNDKKLTLVKEQSLEYYRAEPIATPHCFTTRLGGVSSGYLDSLNLGIHRGDSPENVLKNYAILGDALGFDPKQTVLSKQTHSDIVRKVGRKEWGAGLYAPELSQCDGLITNEPGTALVVFTADCTPVLLWDPVTGAVGAVHAGWRGTAAGIAGKTVKAMEAEFGAKPENIRAAIGPNIGQCCFETDSDVPDAILAAYGEAAKDYIRAGNEKYYVNLKAVNALNLRQAGVEDISVSDCCTACQNHRFWSHRVVGNERGSQGAVILCKEG